MTVRLQLEGRNLMKYLQSLLVLALLTMGQAVLAQFDVVIQDETGVVGGTVDNINEGETLLSLGGAPEATDTPTVLHYLGTGGAGSIPGGAAFPGGFNSTDDFALSATGTITGIGTDPNLAPGGVFRFGVNSDDGFRVRINGNVIGEFVDPKGPSDVFFDAAVKNGDQLSLTFFERGGGEEVEFFIDQDTSGGGLVLVNDAGSFVGVTQGSVSAPFAEADFGFSTTFVQASNNAGFDAAFNNNNLVDNVDEGEALLAAGGGAVSGTRLTIQGDGPEAGFAGGDDFAYSATGFIALLDADGNINTTTSEDVSFYVNSDDGFRLRINGDVVSEFTATTGGSNTISLPITVETGDLLELIFFERSGGEFVDLFRDFDGLLGTTDDRELIGLNNSGVLITQAPFVAAPEPASIALWSALGLVLAGVGYIKSRRKR